MQHSSNGISRIRVFKLKSGKAIPDELNVIDRPRGQSY